jgi:hypothetical protein
LGEGGFDSSAAAGAFVAMITLTRGNDTVSGDGFFASTEAGNQIRGVDVSEPRTATEKATQLLSAEIKSVDQAKQLENPDAIISLTRLESEFLLSRVADYAHGLAPGDTARFTRKFWEIASEMKTWCYMASTPKGDASVSGKSLKILNPELISNLDCKGFRYDGRNAWGKRGLVIGKMKDLPASFYNGEVFDDNIHAVIPQNQAHLIAIAAFIKHGDFATQIRRYNQKLAITSSSVVKVPSTSSTGPKSPKKNTQRAPQTLHRRPDPMDLPRTSLRIRHLGRIHQMDRARTPSYRRNRPPNCRRTPARIPLARRTRS